MTKLIKFFIKLFVIFLAFSGSLLADWPCRSDSAVPIITLPGNQWNVRLVSDQKNGSIMLWQDRRDGFGDKLYLQRVSPTGVFLWQTNGIKLTNTSSYQYYPQAISDGRGGVLIVWQDNRSGYDYDIYAQRVDANGTMCWGADGMLVCGAQGHQYNPQLVTDGAAGILVVWQDKRNGQFDIYAQRIDSLGQIKWIANGQPICTDPSDQMEPKLSDDHKGGAIVAWSDYRLGTGSTDIYAQRILSTSQPAWSENGIPVCTSPNAQFNIQMVSDTIGGVILAWQDRRNTTYDNIFAQRIDPNGIIKWPINGIPLAQVSGTQNYPQIASDHTGGAIVVWQDNRRGTDYDIYGQRIGREGVILWASTGVPICGANGHQYNPQLVVQGTSSVVVWQDKRQNDYDIYAQRLNSFGQPYWTIDGNPVSTIPLDQFMPQLTSDSLYGAIIAWADYHLNNGSTDLFAQRIGANGLSAGGCYRTFIQDSLGVKAKRFIRLKKFIDMPNAGNTRDSIFMRGIFPYGLVIGIEKWDYRKYYGWERYDRSVYVRRSLPQTWTPRPFDYIYDHRLFTNEIRNPSLYRYNNRLVGELIALKLNIAASDLGITERGLGDLIYKDTTSQSSGLLNNKKLRQLVVTVDSMLTLWSYYPKVNYNSICAAIQKINWAFEGKFDTISTSPLRITSTKPLFSISFLKPSSDSPTPIPEIQAPVLSGEIPNKFILYQNYPNPFNPMTTIEFDLPELSVVTLRIYNVLGQEVSVPIDRLAMDAERQILDYDASGLSSGVYFYQVIAEPIDGGGSIMTQVKKMLVLK
jgi:hypothetical protein